MGQRHKRQGPMWRGRDNGIPNGADRQRYVQQLGDQLRGTSEAPTREGRVLFRMNESEPWRDLGRAILPVSLSVMDPIRSADGTIMRANLLPNPSFDWDVVLRAPSMDEIRREAEMRMRDMRDALQRMSEAMASIQPLNLPQFEVQRGGITYEQGGMPPSLWGRRADPRQGEEVYVYDILPGARVYVLEDVFTVDRVDMEAPLPTVWLKELPTSPLYFSEDESIYLANETEDQS